MGDCAQAAAERERGFLAHQADERHLFEAFRAPTLRERLRGLCLLPLAAVIALLVGSDLETVIGPSRIFYWIVDGIALAGAFGIGFAVRTALPEWRSIDWRAGLWLLLCLMLSLLCAHLFVVLTGPYAWAGT